MKKYLMTIISLIGAGAWAQVPSTPLEQQLEQQAQQLMQQAQQNSQQSQQDMQQAQQDIQQAQALESQTTTTTTTTQVTQGQTVAGTGANSSARNEKILDMALGAVLAGTGGLIMKKYGTQMSWDCGGSGGDSPECHKDHIMFYGVGLGLLAEGAVVIGIGATRSTQIAATSGGTQYSSPGDGLGTGSAYTPTPTAGPAPQPAVPIQVQSTLQTASAPAIAAGINPASPSSIAAARMNAGLSNQDIAGNGMQNLPPEAVAEVKEIAAQQAAKFHVASVPLEEGGGGGRGGGGARGNYEQSEVASASAEIDLGGGQRLPDSIEGMSKLYRGNRIGVASDNIFGMMTRRYSSKISASSFIEPSVGSGK